MQQDMVVIQKEAVAPSGWWTGERILPTPVNPCLTVQNYIREQPRAAALMGLYAGMGLKEAAAGAIRAGWVGYRLAKETGDRNPGGEGAHHILAATLEQGRDFARTLLVLGRMELDAPVIIADAWDRVLFSGPARDL